MVGPKTVRFSGGQFCFGVKAFHNSTGKLLLVKIPTGAMREGEAVTKSRLETSKEAPVISRYLKLRAKGIPRVRALGELENRISKMMKMASDLENPAPALREVDKLERARNALMSEIRRLETEYTAASMLDGISEDKIAKFLHGIAGNMESLSREALKDFLSNVIGQVTLDPATHECQIDYRIGINLGDKVAAPRGRHLIPQIQATSIMIAIL